MSNIINWFEIPVLNLERAVEFYTKIFGQELQISEMGGYKMAFFPMDGEGVGGALTEGEGMVPTENGVVIYLNGGEDLQPMLDRAEKAGASILVPKSMISEEIGYFAMFIDSEGNKLALHSSN